MIELLGDRRDFNIITKNHIFINMKIILTEEQFNRVILKEDDKPKHSITKKKNSKRVKDGLKKLFNSIFKKDFKNKHNDKDIMDEKYGINPVSDINSSTYRYMSNKQENEKVSSENITLSVSESIGTNFSGGTIENGKCITKLLQLNIQYSEYSADSYTYMDSKFYSGNDHLDTLITSKKGRTDFICSVNTFINKTGNCEPPKEMINIIKEKLLPTEYGNEIKSNLQNIGISI